MSTNYQEYATLGYSMDSGQCTHLHSFALGLFPPLATKWRPHRRSGESRPCGRRITTFRLFNDFMSLMAFSRGPKALLQSGSMLNVTMSSTKRPLVSENMDVPSPSCGATLYPIIMRFEIWRKQRRWRRRSSSLSTVLSS